MNTETPKKAPLPDQEHAASVNDSVTPDYIICLEDGKKLKTLRRYLKTNYNLTPEEYRKRWGLPASYPMVAPNYAKKRSQLAKATGLGRKPSASKAKLSASALKWRDAQVSYFKENPSSDEERAHADAENLQWLESLSGDELVWAHKVYTSAREKLALYQRAEEWRDDMLSANLPQNDWLKSLAGMDSEQLAKEYQFFIELWCAPETEGETPETAEEQE
jgi:hypothetical protein